MIVVSSGVILAVLFLSLMINNCNVAGNESLFSMCVVEVSCAGLLIESMGVAHLLIGDLFAKFSIDILYPAGVNLDGLNVATFHNGRCGFFEVSQSDVITVNHDFGHLGRLYFVQRFGCLNPLLFASVLIGLLELSFGVVAGNKEYAEEYGNESCF